MKVRVTHTIDEEIAERLDQAKKETKIPKSSIVQEAIQMWLGNRNKQLDKND